MLAEGSTRSNARAWSVLGSPRAVAGAEGAVEGVRQIAGCSTACSEGGPEWSECAASHARVRAVVQVYRRGRRGARNGWMEGSALRGQVTRLDEGLAVIEAQVRGFAVLGAADVRGCAVRGVRGGTANISESVGSFL